MPASAGVLALLDELQAAERAGADALGQWIASCRDPRLRGGLRVIRARDTAHAALATDRLRVLGGTPSAGVSPALGALFGVLVAPGGADAAKLSILVARFPRQMHDPVVDLVRGITDDDETRALLETVGDDDRASLRWLRTMLVPPLEAEPPAMPVERHLTVRFLDAVRAAEAAGAEVVGAWIETCTLDGLRGGLRTIAAREGTHARLLAERVAELGGQPRATLAPGVWREAMTSFGAFDISDESKLARVLARQPDAAGAAAPLLAVADQLRHDVESRELLRLVAAAEGATIAWLSAYRAALGARPGAVTAPPSGAPRATR